MWQTYWLHFLEMLKVYIPRVIEAAVILVIGLWIIRIIKRTSRKIMGRREVDESVKRFVYDLIKWLSYVLLFVIVITKLGIPTTSFVAIIGAAGLAVGLALQGSLANFAGGVLILLFRPFKIGDYISAQGISGTVREISIFTTSLRTDGNQLAIIPNGQLSNEKIINYSVLEQRAEMMDFIIGNRDDLNACKNALLEVALKQDRIINDNTSAPKVVVKAINEYIITLQLQYRTKTSDFWATHFTVLEEGKKALDTARELGNKK